MLSQVGMQMPTILVLDDDAIDTDLIQRVAANGEYTVLVSKNLEEFQFHLESRPIDLAVISLATVSDKDTARLQDLLRQIPGMKVLAVASAQSGDGLTTLLRTESILAQHLIAKPIDPQHFLDLLALTFPQPTGQD